MGGSWKSAGRVLGKMLETEELRDGYRKHAALLHWSEVVGGKIAERARPQGIRGKTLFVEVDGSAWIQELSFLKEDILRELNERAGDDALDQIVFRAAGSGGWR